MENKRNNKNIKRLYILIYLNQYSRNLKIKKLCKKVLTKELNNFIKKNTTFFDLFFGGEITKIPYGQSFKNILHRISFK